MCDVCSPDLSERLVSVESQSKCLSVRTLKLEYRPRRMEDYAAPELGPHEEGVPAGV